MKQKILLMLAFWLAFTWGAQAQSNALYFDGTDDYVACPAINPTQFTVAAWVCPTVTDKAQVIFSTLNETTYKGMELFISGVGLPIFTVGDGTTMKQIIPTTAIYPGQWVHIAATYDGSTTRLFINGNEVASRPVPTYSAGTEALCFGRSSVYSLNALHFQGLIDEAGIWGTSKSDEEIRTNLLNGLSGNDAGLLACYKFDQGLPEGNNPAETTLSDVSGNGKNCTLNNFALSGTSSNWVGGYLFPYGSNALHFDGVDDYVSCPAINSTYFTYEAWVYPTELGKNQVILSTLNETSFTGFELLINTNNNPEITIGTGSALQNITSTTTINLNTWTHIAVTYSSLKTFMLLINGIVKKWSSIQTYTPGSQVLCIGRKSSTAGQYFSGKIDEVRIWNAVLDQTTISNNMNITPTITGSDLKAYYTFDQGIADGNNSSIVTLLDASKSGNNGRLHSFGYTGTKSNWVKGRMMVNPSKPSLTFASAKSNDLSFEAKVLSDDYEYVDWGNGSLIKYAVTSTGTTITASSYITGNTVKVYKENINYLNVSDKAITALDVSKNPALQDLICNNNQLSIATLPQPKSSYTTYTYAPQQQLVASCTNGVVDLSAQLTALDVNGNPQTTVYTWYDTNHTPLVLGVDYTANNGVFSFIKKLATPVYCTMANAAFPDFKDADILRTTNITVVLTWTGATSNDWHTATNWAEGVLPTSATDVVIPVGASNYPTISASASCKSLTLKSDATGTATLLLNSDLTVSNGSTVEQYITGHLNTSTGAPNGRFWYLSSPVSNAKSDVFDAAAANNKLWPYSEAAHNYVEITDNTTTLEVGRGYCVRQGSTGSVVFKGTLNNGSTTINVSYANDGHVKQGFNLVGNPYPSYIDWNSASLTKTNLVNSYWVRGFNGTAMVFETYINGKGTSISGTDMDGKIAPMQAFWVKANGINSSLTISPLALTHSGQKLVKGGTVDERPILRLRVSNGTQADEAIVLFDEKATNGFDNQYDAPKLSNDDVTIPEIYTLSGTREIVINSLKDVATNKEVALGFRTGKAGKFTIKASEIKNFSQAVNLILEDKLTGTKQNLAQTPEYAFSSEVATVNNRFVLHFAESTTGIDEVGESTKVNIWLGADNQLTVELGKAEGKGRIQIYTPLGQQLLAKEFAGTQTQLTLNYQPGVYLVSVITGNQKTTRKIVIQ